MVTRRLGGRLLGGQVRRGAVGSVLLAVGTAPLALLVSVVLARMLGVADFGVYSFAFALVTLLAIPAQSGLPQLVVRETARYREGGNLDAVRGLWRWSTGCVALFSAAIALLTVLTLIAVSGGSQTPRTATLLAGLGLIPLIALANLRGAALRGLGQVTLGQLPERLVRPVVLIGLVLAALAAWPTENFSAPLAMGLHCAAAAVAFLLGAWLLRRGSRAVIANTRPVYADVRHWSRAFLPLSLVAGLTVANENIDLLLVGFLRSDVEVGVYRAAVQGGVLVLFGMQALKFAIMPHIARLHAAGDLAGMQRLAIRGAQVALLAALPPGLMFLLFGDWLLVRVFGPGFAEGYVALAIISLGQLVNAAMGFVGVLLNMTGHERDAVRGILLSTFVHVGLCLLLIPAWGIEGAAVARFTQVIVWNVLLHASVRIRLGVGASVLGRPPKTSLLGGGQANG
ncbi:MAG: flippase [Pseudomonadota bacterium]|nr:flippase [Pseudomonadota bacterium]